MNTSIRINLIIFSLLMALTPLYASGEDSATVRQSDLRCGDNGVCVHRSTWEPYTGEARDYYENGQLMISQEYQNGRRIGKYKEFSEDGQLRLFVELDFMGHQYYEEYNDNGRLKVKGNKHEVFGKNGVWEWYSESGLLMKVEKYKDGKLLETKNYKKENPIYNAREKKQKQSQLPMILVFLGSICAVGTFLIKRTDSVEPEDDNTNVDSDPFDVLASNGAHSISFQTAILVIMPLMSGVLFLVGGFLMYVGNPDSAYESSGPSFRGSAVIPMVRYIFMTGDINLLICLFGAVMFGWGVSRLCWL